MKNYGLILMTGAVLLFSALGHCQTPYKGISEIRMRRLGCAPGACPTDDLILRSQRDFAAAYYVGEAAVQPLGVNRGHVPSYRYKALIDFLESQDFFSQKDTPPMGVGGDQGTIISVVRDGKRHQLRIRYFDNSQSAIWGIIMSVRGLAADIEWNKHQGGVQGNITDFLPALNSIAPASLAPPKYYLWAQRADEEYRSWKATADEKGTFELILPPGEYVLSASRVDNSSLQSIGEVVKVQVPEFGFVKIKQK